jgi:hypothetical protein
MITKTTKEPYEVDVQIIIDGPNRRTVRAAAAVPGYGISTYRGPVTNATLVKCVEAAVSHVIEDMNDHLRRRYGG